MSLDNGIVLPGVTRQSIIELLEDHASGKKAFPFAEGDVKMPEKIRVVERDISMGEILEGLKDGSLKGYVFPSFLFLLFCLFRGFCGVSSFLLYLSCLPVTFVDFSISFSIQDVRLWYRRRRRFHWWNHLSKPKLHHPF